MIMTPRIGPAFSTERLDLRPIVPGDADRIVALANDRAVARMTSFTHPFGHFGAEALIRRAARANLDDEVWFAVDLPGEGLIGTLSFKPDGALAPEAGYWLGRPYWGRGFMTEVLTGALRWVKADWRRRCLSARHFVDNPASARVLERAGFLYTGRVELRHCPARDEQVLNRWMVWLA
jgi:RimJ/RimL family protein N-acetyltransferase